MVFSTHAQMTPQMKGISGEISILTGALAAPYGLPMQRGFELAREEINNSGQLGDAKIHSSPKMIRAPLRTLSKPTIN